MVGVAPEECLLEREESLLEREESLFAAAVPKGDTLGIDVANAARVRPPGPRLRPWSATCAAHHELTPAGKPRSNRLHAARSFEMSASRLPDG